MSDISANEYLEEQERLHDEARSSMPWDPNSCTYTLGPLRQQLFACRTHKNIGICYSCSIQCHTKCDIVELFTKRHFTCDCGTERDSQPIGDSLNENEFCCELRQNKEPDIPASDNIYNENFKGLFCDCAKEYDPESDSVMLQCIAGLECDEDWYHDYCIMNVDPKVTPRKSDVNDESPDKELEGFPEIDSFDSYICWKCISKNDWFFKQILSSEVAEELVAHKLNRQTEIAVPKLTLSTDTKKRNWDKDGSGTDAETEYSLFLQKGYSDTLKKLKESLDKESKLYSFLTYKIPFLLDDEPVYEQIEDSGLNNDVYDIAMQALSGKLQHEPTINSIVAFQNLKSKLGDFFKTFAEKDDVIKEEDIRNFFNTHKKDDEGDS